MFRFRYLRLRLRLNFPGHRLKAWLRHTPCDEHECDICNPLVENNPALW